MTRMLAFWCVQGGPCFSKASRCSYPVWTGLPGEFRVRVACAFRFRGLGARVYGFRAYGLGCK